MAIFLVRVVIPVLAIVLAIVIARIIVNQRRVYKSIDCKHCKHVGVEKDDQGEGQLVCWSPHLLENATTLLPNKKPVKEVREGRYCHYFQLKLK